MSQPTCEHKRRARVQGPYEHVQKDYRVVCKDCLEHLLWGMNEKKDPKEELHPNERMNPSDVLDAIPDDAKLSEFETGFVTDFRDRAKKYQSLRLTEKQQAIFDRLQLKFVGRGKQTMSAPDFADIPF